MDQASRAMIENFNAKYVSLHVRKRLFTLIGYFCVCLYAQHWISLNFSFSHLQQPSSPAFVLKHTQIPVSPSYTVRIFGVDQCLLNQ